MDMQGFGEAKGSYFFCLTTFILDLIRLNGLFQATEKKIIHMQYNQPTDVYIHKNV